MISPSSHSSLGLSASAEQSSESGPPSLTCGSSEDSTGSSEPLSIWNSLPNGFAAHKSGTMVPVVSASPAAKVHSDLPNFLRAECAVGSHSPLIKRTPPLIEYGSIKSHSNTGILLQIPSFTEVSTGKYASHSHDPERASSRARAPAFGGSRSVSYAQGFQIGGETPRRSYKGLLCSSDPRVNDEREVAMPLTSATPRTTAFKEAPARPLFESAGLNSLSDYRDGTDASVSNNSSMFVPTRESCDSHLSTGPLSAHLRTPISSSLSSSALTPWSSVENSTSSGSIGSPYGSPGVPIPRPPYQILPTPHALVSQQNTPQPSVEADGYTIIRNAVSPTLVGEVVASIYNGLSVTTKYETEKIYITPSPAYKVRDEFLLKWRPALRPFYEPLGRSIPIAPSKCVVGSFTESEPRDFAQSFIHVGNKNKIYVHIALTYLSPETGFYNILGGSHLGKHAAPASVQDRIQTPVVLREGDAIVWRGDLHYLWSSNHGGHWQHLTFDWGPEVIDLTGES